MRFLLCVLLAGCGQWVPTKPQDVSADADMDGFVAGQDCDDNDASTYPEAPVYCDGQMDKDRDCDAVLDLNVCDYDGDGYAPADGDCDDRNPAASPGRAETCGNEVDNDCDGAADDADPDCADDTGA